MFEVKVNEADKTVKATDLPKLDKVTNDAVAAALPNVEFWVHTVEAAPDKFDVLTIEWKDGTRLYLDELSVATFRLFCRTMGSELVLDQLHRQGNALEGVYRIISE